MSDWLDEVIGLTGDPIGQAAIVLILGGIAGFLLGRLTTGILNALGLQEIVEGTSSERWLQRMGTSTTSFIGRLVSMFTYLAAILSAVVILGLIQRDLFWELATAWLPQLFIAVLVVIVGIVLADKVEIYISEQLQGIKLPEVALIPAIVKYSIIFIAVLIALGQVGVDTTALIVVLSVYILGLVILGAIALQDFLASGAAGVYILLREPYTIGDEIYIDDTQGVVQEIDIFVTHIESDGHEYIVPNRRLIKDGVQRVR